MTKEQQQQQFIEILDAHQSMGVNAVIVQVKPNADALYPSDLAPWSEWLTGVQGQAPGYDPLAFMLVEAKKRNMEFHAWFNPYRVSLQADLLKLTPDHPARQHPEWVVSYGGKLYFNPGIPETREYILQSIMEVVERYDIDGVHMDDHFYPYPVASAGFNDDAAYAAYGGGFANKADWRRSNVDALVEMLSERIKQAKPHVKFGISPFGIWRNKSSDPQGSDTNGLQSYDAVYADSRKWVREEWVDYIMPQLYWHADHPAASYTKLTDWWVKQVQGRNVHLYIGHSVYKIAEDPAWTDPDELPNQIRYNRSTGAVKGSALFATNDVLANPKNIRQKLANDVYAVRALVPAMEWLPAAPLEKPVELTAARSASGIELSWKPGASGAKPAAYYAVYRVEGRTNGTPQDIVNSGRLLATVRSEAGGLRFVDEEAAPDAAYTYTVTALDRLHRESEPAAPAYGAPSASDAKALLSGPSFVRSGEPFQLEFGLSGAAGGALAQDITVTYDVYRVQFEKFGEASGNGKDGYRLVDYASTPGKLRFLTVDLTTEEADAANDRLLSLHFTANATGAPTSTEIAVTNARVADRNGQESALAGIALDIALLPIGSEPGDANGDGRMSVGDLGLIAKAYGMTASDPQWPTYRHLDVNRDGAIGIEDLAHVARRILQTPANN